MLINADKGLAGAYSLKYRLNRGFVYRYIQHIPNILKINIVKELLNKHQIITAYTLNNPNVIRLESPLTVSYEQLDQLLAALDEIFAKNKGFGDMVITSSKTILASLVK